MSQQLNSVRALLRACRPELVTVGIITFFINMLMLTLPLYTLQMFSRVFASGSMSTLVLLTVIAVFAMIVMGILYFVRSRVTNEMSNKIDAMLGENLLRLSIKNGLLNNTSRDAQGLRDLAQVRNFLAGGELPNLFDTPWVPMYLFIIWIFDPLLGYVAIAGAIIMISFAIANEVLSRRPLRIYNTASVLATQEAESMVKNAEAIESMGMMNGVVRQWRKMQSVVLSSNSRSNKVSSFIGTTSRTVRLMVQIAVTAVGAYQVVNHSISPGAFVVANILMARALAPVDAAIGTWRSVVAFMSAARRLDAMMQDLPRMQTSSMSLPAPKGRIAVDRVVFRHRVGGGLAPAILKGVSFAIEPGEALGIVGPSGSGKSTLVKCIVGVWRPFSGTVRLDGADVAQWDSEDLGQYVGYLPQDVDLFNASIRDNISRFQEADPKDIVEAAQLAGVHDLILRMPNGYETKIGTSNYILSGGQRQRIGLARALFGSPKMLVLDEPNANLDTEGEAALRQALTHCKQKGVTVIVIAHRPSILSNVDKMLFMRDGQVELFGPPAEVMARLSPPGGGAARPRVVSAQGAGVPAERRANPAAGGEVVTP
ncbi:ATP-binding cassette subfamily C protein EexD [Stella humosa]|uniref:ATP-binding cassette subfamily C protein EexD n=1 Tax=Stella humosa TaxID=94 RepID=A0A3N1MKQ2_9PROT|nr:type I secretion system permease/ATPase [Stella humosa]ROQ03100.1 ATP-binding cassette subfamily C protein EexD [Stella humosa]BBK30186.1 transporter HasD [Stella humosa]